MTKSAKKSAAPFAAELAVLAAPAKAAAKPVATVEVTTQPLRKAHAPRVVSIPKGSRVNRHHNDDGSVTLYAKGIKIFRTASDQQIEDGEVAEDYDADEAIEKFLKKWFGRKEYVFGKTTHGHCWKNKKRLAEEAAALVTDAAK